MRRPSRKIRHPLGICRRLRLKREEEEEEGRHATSRWVRLKAAASVRMSVYFQTRAFCASGYLARWLLFRAVSALPRPLPLLASDAKICWPPPSSSLGGRPPRARRVAALPP